MSMLKGRNPTSWRGERWTGYPRPARIATTQARPNKANALTFEEAMADAKPKHVPTDCK